MTEPAKVSESRWRFSRKGDWILPKVASDIDGHHRRKASIRLFSVVNNTIINCKMEYLEFLPFKSPDYRKSQAPCHTLPSATLQVSRPDTDSRLRMPGRKSAQLGHGDFRSRRLSTQSSRACCTDRHSQRLRAKIVMNRLYSRCKKA